MSSEEQVDGAAVTVRVPAKINLFLAVRGVRGDGFHELVTVMQTLGLHDELRVGVYGPPGQGHHPAARRRMRLELRIDGPSRHATGDALPGPEDNLIIMAARALSVRSGVLAVDAADATDGTDVESRLWRGPRTVLELRKGIPVAGGMAGGSADAAAALVALNRLWDCNLNTDQLREVAALLGSDVPFCVTGGTALATGRGTRLAQVLCRGEYHWVVCTSDRQLATTAVYRAWDQHCRPTEVEPDAVLAALRGQDAEALGAALYNDLQAAAFRLRPELGERRRALLDAGALGAVLSGSGPTLLALTDSAAEAQRLAERIAGDYAGVHAVSAPAAGPDARPRRLA